jgi:hypothetical protein
VWFKKTNPLGSHRMKNGKDCVTNNIRLISSQVHSIDLHPCVSSDLRVPYPPLALFSPQIFQAVFSANGWHLSFGHSECEVWKDLLNFALTISFSSVVECPQGWGNLVAVLDTRSCFPLMSWLGHRDPFAFCCF